MNTSRSLATRPGSEAPLTAYGSEHSGARLEREPGLVDLGALLAIIQRRLVPILVVSAAVIAMALLAYWFTNPTYYASTHVVLDRQVANVVPDGADTQRQIPTDSETVDTEVQIIQSPAVLSTVVDKLNLAQRPGFGFNEDDPPSGEGNLEAQKRRALQVLQSKLKVQREGTSYAIALGFTWGDPRTPAQIVNATADAYVEGEKRRLALQTKNDVKVLAERLQGLREDVRVAEEAVADYRERNNLVDLYNNDAVAQQQIATMDERLADLRSAQAAAAARSSMANGANAGDVAESGVLQNLRAQEATLVDQEASLSTRYGPRFPDLIKVRKQLEAVRGEIAQETARVQKRLAAESKVAASQAASLGAAVNDVLGKVRAGNKTSVELAELKRKADTASSLYSALLERYRRAVATEGAERGKAFVVSPAVPSFSPVSPSLKLYLAIGVIAAIIASALLVLIMEMFELGVRTRRELEIKLHVPVIAATPDLHSIPEAKGYDEDPSEVSDYAVANSGSLLGESFRSARTAFRIGRDGQTVHTLAITSSVPNEGKTTIALALAKSASMSGSKVVLVDCDERKRSSSMAFSPHKLGLAEVLEDPSLLDQALIYDLETGLTVLPQRTDRMPDFDSFASDAMQNLIAELEKRFDLVILDTAPVLAIAETSALAAMADKVLFVTRWRKTRVQTARRALDQLSRSGAKVAGAVLSMVPVRGRSVIASDDEMQLYDDYRGYYT